MPEKLLLLGDEAVALGALHAGLSGVYAYPGTPSTEITEYIQNHPMTRERGVHSDWCTNEKTAMEAALGVSYAGKRALVCMKHVGMNVCADGFMNSAVTGANGGLVVVACDDPSQHSSQNEQDSRFYAEFAQVPCFEPSNQQEAYDMVREAFDYSEENHIPVLMRLPTRMAHSRAVVQAREPRGQNEMHFPSADRAKFWVTLPGISRVRIKELADDQIRFRHDSELSEDNLYTDGPDHSMGIVACGIAYNYLMENYPDGCPYPTLKVTRYPFPKQLLQKITETCKTILVIEEGQPLVEEKLRGLLYEEADAAIKVKGRLDGSLPRTGELNPDHVRKAVGLPASQEFEASKVTVPRPPALCMGCGHRDFYTALNNVLKKYEGSRVFGGASLTMAIGAANSGVWPSVGVIGDSTFTHSGMTGLLDAVNSGADITLCISDNLTTGMTGGQDSAGTGKLERICEAIGVAPEHIRTIVPLPKNYPEMEAVIDEELNYHGVSVVICRRECIQTAKRHAKLAKKI